MMTTEDLRYPLGRFAGVAPGTADVRAAAVEVLAELPARMRDAVADLTDAQLDSPYRPGGWTVRQLVHHVADSHMNSYIRLKLALTEDTPAIAPYDEGAWAQLPDSQMPIEMSLGVLDGIHARMVALYRAMRPEQFLRTFRHPEFPGEPRTLDSHVQLYAWHSRHHVAHVTALRQREGW